VWMMQVGKKSSYSHHGFWNEFTCHPCPDWLRQS
jgi:hypothetical protein